LTVRETAFEDIVAHRLHRGDEAEDQAGIASRVLVERFLLISHEGWLRLPLKLPPQRQPGFHDAAGTLPLSIEFLSDVSPSRRRGGKPSRESRR